MKQYLIHILKRYKMTASIARKLRYMFFFILTKKKWKSLKASEFVFLELGSGAKKGSNGWTTVDVYGADITHDLRQGIPLPDDSVDRIYTSHMLEHIPYLEMLTFLRDCLRVLKQGGELSVCVPNASLYIRAYIEGRSLWKPGTGFKPATVDTNSLLDQVNYIAYLAGQHHYMFDEENLVNTIKKIPFSSVELRSFDKEIDLPERDNESIYVSAWK